MKCKRNAKVEKLEISGTHTNISPIMGPVILKKDIHQSTARLFFTRLIIVTSKQGGDRHPLFALLCRHSTQHCSPNT